MKMDIRMGLCGVAASALLWCGCGAEENTAPINPDPVTSGPSATTGAGGATASSSTSSTSTSSAGGNGAGGSETGPAGYKSGSRLKAHYYVGADGSRQFRAWYDSQLDILCDWRVTDIEHRMRCVPLSYNTLPERLYFSNSNCTGDALSAIPQPLLWGPYFQTKKYRVHSQKNNHQYSVRVEVYEVLDKVAQAKSRKDTEYGPCYSASGTMNVLSGPLPPDMFVEASFELDK